MALSLVIVNGASPGATLQLTADVPVTIGRHDSRDLVLDDDLVSRLHARVACHARRWYLKDCGSLNGTYVNAQPVQQTVLEPGDLIRIGERLILFVSDDQEADDERVSLLQPRPTALMTTEVESRRELVERDLGSSLARAYHDSSKLCRIVHVLQEHTDTDSLLRVATDVLVEGIRPDIVSLWLAGADGRLRCAGSWGEVSDKHMLASLAVEKNKAVLIEESGDVSTVQEVPSNVGSSIGVPIPRRSNCRGGIECHRRTEHGPFQQNELDYVVVVAHQLGLALENLEHRERLERANDQLQRELANHTKLEGSSRAIKGVLEQIARVGPTSSVVLILGESGTGKELVAHAIHAISLHSAGPYIAVNCAAFSESLLESELFGHEVGAFTGADRRHIGQFERAHRGTIFLDEIGEMSLSCQAKLLRVLEGHPFNRLGGQETIQVEVRLIAATHRDLLELIRQGRFREDLYYRLRVVDLPLPPLRDRADDVIELAASFLDRFHQQTGRGPWRLSEDAIAAIRQHDWPGNVRELKNAIERAVVLGCSEEIVPQDLGLPNSERSGVPQPSLTSLREAERRHIEHVLRQVGGNKMQACRVLGIGRGTLYKKIEEYRMT